MAVSESGVSLSTYSKDHEVVYFWADTRVSLKVIFSWADFRRSSFARYGLAADALIALGGLTAAARDEDGGEARRMLTLTKESLNDILTICFNNNLNKTD